MENVFLNFLREVIFLKFEENKLILKTFSKTFKPTKHGKIGKHFFRSYQTHPISVYMGGENSITKTTQHHDTKSSCLFDRF